MNIFTIYNNISFSTLKKSSINWCSIPDSALLRNGKPFFIPDFAVPCHLELRPVIRISRLGKCIRSHFAHRYIDALTIAAHFIARTSLSTAIESGLPWTASVGFDGAVSLGDFIAIDTLSPLTNTVSATLSGQQICNMCLPDLTLQISEVISQLSKYNTLRNGDLILLPPFNAAIAVETNQRIEAYWNEKPILSFSIK